MKIYRRHNGQRVSYTLSRTELRKAYLEQQQIYDVGDIKNELDSNSNYYNVKFGLAEKPVRKNEIEEMTRLLRYNFYDSADSIWSICVRDAVKKILSERG